MSFTLEPADYTRLRKLLASQPFLKTTERQLDFVSGVFTPSPDAKILHQLQTRGDGFSYAVQMIDFLSHYDDGRALRTFLDGVVERLGEGESGDVVFLKGLATRLGPVGQSATAAKPPPQQPSTVVIDTTPFMTELAKLRTELVSLQQADRSDVTAILQAVLLQRSNAEQTHQHLADLSDWAVRALRDVRSGHAELAAQLQTLTQHEAGVNQYFQASIPLIPGLLSYSIELGSAHTADLKAIWERLKARLGGLRSRDGLDAPAAAEIKPTELTRARKAHAVLAGVNRYADTSISSLNYCARDVTAVQQVLAQRGFLTQLFADGQTAAPERVAVLKQLAIDAKTAKAEDLLLFYFSGHGLADQGDGYLLSRDTDFVVKTQSAIKTDDVLDLMTHSPAAAKVLILDACHSGAQIGKAPLHMTAEFIERVYRKARGVAVLASCAQDEVAWEDGNLGHGVFSTAVLEALSGLADFEGKGFVTVGDLHRYAVDRVAVWCRDHGKLQTPTLEYKGSGDIVLVDLT
jgi:Caspase domain